MRGFTTFEDRIHASTGGIKLDTERPELAWVPRDGSMYNRGVELYTSLINEPWGVEGPGFDIAKFKGKKLLDLGSGVYESFGLDARKDGVDVVSVNPALALPEHRHALLDTNHAQEREQPRLRAFMRGMRTVLKDIRPGNMTVASFAQALPFRADTFDGVVSVYGAPYYMHSSIEYSKDPKIQKLRATEEVAKAFSEIVRVLKPGATAYLVDGWLKEGFVRVSDGGAVDTALQTLDGATYRVFEQEVDSIFGQNGLRRRTICITKNKD